MTSDLTQIKTWWRTLGGEGFVVLPPPTRNRYTQSDGHDDAVEYLDARGLPLDTSFAYWHWQSHAAFERDGSLGGPLRLHWGGDYETVKAGLGAAPDGFELVDNGPGGAFTLDRLTVRDADGLPSLDDPAAVRQFLDELNEPIDRRVTTFIYPPLTPPQERWLHAALAASDLAEQGAFLTALAARDADTPQEAAAMLASWRERYPDAPTDYDDWFVLLRSLVRHGNDAAWSLVDEIGPKTARILSQFPSERAIAVLRGFALAGDASAAGHWVAAYAAAHDIEPIDAAAVVGAELDGAVSDDLWGPLAQEVGRQAHVQWAAGERPKLLLTPLAHLRMALDERLPVALRAAAARGYKIPASRMIDSAEGFISTDEIVPGYTLSNLRADVARFREVTAGLAESNGPSLTGYEGGLTRVWDEYRTLTPAQIGWLHKRVADPATEMQGLGFCLELLYAHGQGTTADVDALRKRWKKDLTKKYATTYTEWRHPLVTLTCLAHDLGDPVAADLDTWWAKPTPKWKANTRLLTLLGAPTEAKAAELWEYVASGAHDEGQLMTWVLLRARLDGVRPLDVADSLIGSPIRPYVLNRVLIGVADPAQPLWHYSSDPGSWSWWQRIVAVADDPAVSPAARQIALEEAAEHRLIAYPKHTSGITPEQIAAGQRWYAARQA